LLMDLQRSFLDKRALDFLLSVPISTIKTTTIELITLGAEDIVEEALKKLAMFAVSSAPVFDANKQKLIGALSVLDLAVWIVRTYSASKGDKKHYDWSKVDEEFKTPIHKVLNGVDRFWPVADTESVATLINSYFKWRIHRAPVISGHEIVGHVSQSDVVAFLAKNLNHFEKLANLTLSEMELHSGPVLSVLKSMPLIEAFSNIVETKFTGIAVIDEQGRLVNNISASDLKGITRDTFWKLEMPIEKILGEKAKLPPLTCKPNDTFGDTIKRIADCKVHRIYVVDQQERPTNVITLTTIMKIFSQSGSGCFV